MTGSETIGQNKPCFVIAPIGDEDSETRKRSDQILKHVIKPAADSCGYVATRADEIEQPGIITSQVVQRVVEDPLVIADLTGKNPNVFYELAKRHAIRKPLVQMIQKGEQIPFDVAGLRTIYVDHQDLDSVEIAKDEIISQIGALESNPADMETPISVSLELQILRQSENPEDRGIGVIISEMSNLRRSVSSVHEMVEHIFRSYSARDNNIESRSRINKYNMINSYLFDKLRKEEYNESDVTMKKLSDLVRGFEEDKQSDDGE